MDYFLSISVCVILILLSAVFSASETAYSSLNKTRLKLLAEKGSKKAKRAQKLVEQYDVLLSTILIGNNIVNIALSSLATVLFVSLCGDIGATLSVVVTTVLVLMFGEITPKSIAKDYPEKFAMGTSLFLSILAVVLRPLCMLFSVWKKMISRAAGDIPESKTSPEELLVIVEEVEQEGTLNKNEGNLLKNAIEFSEIKAEDILTHRVDLEAISDKMTREEIEKVFRRSRFSRLPVYSKSIDNITGILHQKDFFCFPEKTVGELATKPIYVLQSESASEILRQLQLSKSHVAVVLDEYGGTLGIVTVEDIVEELVGEIWDEHDEATDKYRLRNDGSTLVDAGETVGDFSEHFGVEIESESVSVGGFMMEKLEKIPEVGDSCRVSGLLVTVEETDGQRVTFVSVRKSAE